MRILLIKPKATLPTVLALQRFQCLEPLELGYLAAVVPAGHEVRVLDLRLHRFPDWTLKRELAWTRATTVLHSPELLRRWREIGLDGVFVGFEFATNQELKAARKGGTVAHNERAHETLRQLGIACHAAFMIRPEYGHAEFQRLRDYVNAMPPAQCSFTVCTPSPGTADYAAARPGFWCGDAYELHDCMHPLTPTALPLRDFGALFARQIAEAGQRHPFAGAAPPDPPLGTGPDRGRRPALSAGVSESVPRLSPRVTGLAGFVRAGD
jgi:hypothetical protein